MKWFESYLSNRKRRVKLRNYSDWRIVQSGIPLVAVLWPIHFLFIRAILPQAPNIVFNLKILHM